MKRNFQILKVKVKIKYQQIMSHQIKKQKDLIQTTVNLFPGQYLDQNQNQLIGL